MSILSQLNSVPMYLICRPTAMGSNVLLSWVAFNSIHCLSLFFTKPLIRNTSPQDLIVIGEHLQEDKIRELLKEEETCQS